MIKNSPNTAEKVKLTLKQEHEKTGILISRIKLCIAFPLLVVYWLVPKELQEGKQVTITFLVITVYIALLVVELLLAHRRIQNKWTTFSFAILDFVALSTFVFTYNRLLHQATYSHLKTATFIVFFLFITIQSLRISTRYVILSGVSAIASWIVLFCFALAESPEKVTDNFSGYIAAAYSPISADLDKLLILALFTAILAKRVKDNQKQRKQFIGYYLLAEERSRRKNLQLHLEKEKAEEANRAKSRFLDIISHELNTPLNGILGLTQLQMLKDPESKELKDIMAKGKTLLSHVSRILRFTEVEVGTTAHIGSNIDTREVLLEALDFYSRSKLEHINTFHCKMQHPLPASFDKGKVIDIIYELLSNADKNSHQSKISLDASMVEESHYRLLVIEVADQGKGMSEEQILLAMDLFTQTQAPNTREEDGIGLGIPMIKQLASSMDAWIEIFSDKDVGTTVYLKIPQSKD